jgi:hypothetical protein
MLFMMSTTVTTASFPYASALKRELNLRNREYARRLDLDCREGRDDAPVLCYRASDDNNRHGNFLPQSYQAILNHDSWRKRLAKPHTSAYEALPREGLRWRELDSCNSSDALLMNIFCYPRVVRSRGLCHLLGVDCGHESQFGFRARVPLANGRTDRTEVDMRIGDLLVEAKLTEANFQSKPADVVESYRGFSEVFEADLLPRRNGCYLSYQLIRNVLAAYSNECAFCVMIDARRPDLREAWYAVMSCIRLHSLRLRCKVLTWQELAQALPARVQKFLEEKYGIIAGEGTTQALARWSSVADIA